MKKMKKILLSVFAGLTVLSMLAGCAQQPSSGSPSQSQPSPAPPSGSQPAPAPEAPASQQEAPAPAEPETGKTLVLYFSASGNTRAVAETIAQATGAELYELTPEEPYTGDDLRWTNPDSRVNAEHNDPAHRTAIAGELPDLSAYDTIFLGYPLWWREAPALSGALWRTPTFPARPSSPSAPPPRTALRAAWKPSGGWRPAPTGWTECALGKP